MKTMISPGLLAGVVLLALTGPTRANANEAAAGSVYVPLAYQAGGTLGAPLPRLDLSAMRLWDYSKPWMASQWSNALSPIPWRYDHVVARNDGSVSFFLDALGAPELQAVNGTPARTSGLWEVEVTLPRLRDGLIVAPLWLFNSQSRDEIDFEFAGRKGLDVTMHVYPGGVHQKFTARLFAGQDYSGRRVRFGIALDEKAGKATMLVNGVRVYTFDRAKTRYFVSTAMRPIIEQWAANPTKPDLVNWVGRWQGLGPGERIEMRVHGYRLTF
ncbi:MAG: family 16 glycosylhydrolase [Sphingomonadaceae bacterium]